MNVLISPSYNTFDVDLQIVEDFDNLFRLTRYGDLIAQAETVLVVGVNSNRFYERTLKEILSRIRMNQRVLFILQDNDQLTWFGLKSAIEKLYPGQFKLSSQQKDARGLWLIAFTRSVAAPAYHTAKHDGWTFGVLTLGKRLEGLERLVASVERGVPESYEILIVTPHKLAQFEGRKGVRQIIFTERDDVGWITRKKNLICREARHSDIFICHDRFHLSDSFAADFQRWGYDYALAVPRIRQAVGGGRGLDWSVVSSENHVWSKGGLLDYRAYSRHVYCPGGATVVRRKAWERYPWNENLYWNEHEDVELARRMQRSGEIIYLSDAVVHADEDRWIDQNPMLDFSPAVEVLQGPPVGEMRIVWKPVVNAPAATPAR